MVFLWFSYGQQLMIVSPGSRTAYPKTRSKSAHSTVPVSVNHPKTDDMFMAWLGENIELRSLIYH